ncbi:hypothetical protein ACWCQZ_44190 [Streptomyces sp. NPDC002285]
MNGYRLKNGSEPGYHYSKITSWPVLHVPWLDPYSVRVAAPLALHQATLRQCAALAGDGSAPAGRKAYRTYADRIAAATRMS